MTSERDHNFYNNLRALEEGNEGLEWAAVVTPTPNDDQAFHGDLCRRSGKIWKVVDQVNGATPEKVVESLRDCRQDILDHEKLIAEQRQFIAL